MRQPAPQLKVVVAMVFSSLRAHNVGRKTLTHLFPRNIAKQRKRSQSARVSRAAYMLRSMSLRVSPSARASRNIVQ
jgi:hypothetical protein